MNFYFFIIIVLAVNISLANQPTTSGGLENQNRNYAPVYNFNFSNGDSSNNSINTPTNPQEISKGISEVIPNKEHLKEKQLLTKSYFSRSLLRNDESFYGVIGTFAQTLNDRSESKTKNALAINLLSTSSLWGIKASIGSFESKIKIDDDYSKSNNSKYFQVGINKFIPVFDFLAIDIGGSYEKGKNTTEETYSYRNLTEEFSGGSLDFESLVSNIGLTAFSGNFIFGVQYSQRYIFSTVDKEFIESIMDKEGNLKLNVGLYF